MEKQPTFNKCSGLKSVDITSKTCADCWKTKNGVKCSLPNELIRWRVSKSIKTDFNYYDARIN